MSNAVPDAYNSQLKAAQGAITQARKNLRAMLSTQEGWSRFSLEKITTLHGLAVRDPSSRALADFLCEMTPGKLLEGSLVPGASSDDVAKALATDLRMLKLRSAVVESGLAEQLNSDGEILQGGAFSAARLEATLDDWLRAGRHRGAEYEAAPLSKIDATMSVQASSAEELMHFRNGMLVPVITAIHIWRVLEEYPPEIAEKVGWKDAENSPAEIPVEEVDAVSAELAAMAAERLSTQSVPLAQAAPVAKPSFFARLSGMMTRQPVPSNADDGDGTATKQQDSPGHTG